MDKSTGFFVVDLLTFGLAAAALTGASSGS
jgi:hypothetical protein